MMVIGVHNPIHSILLLILVFVLGSILLFFLHLELFGLIFLVVYIGAIVVLFLFIVMMLDIKTLNTAQRIRDFFEFRNFLLVVIALEVLFYMNQDILYIVNLQQAEGIDFVDLYHYINYWEIVKPMTHMQAIGEAMFSDAMFIKAFLMVGVLLFVAMVGAIVISIEETYKKTVKQQDVNAQILKNVDNTIYVMKSKY